MKSTDLDKDKCPSCGKVIDVATDVTSEAVPKPGDYSICFGCGHLMAFDDRLKVRELTSEEMHEAAGDKDILRHQAALALVRKK